MIRHTPLALLLALAAAAPASAQLQSYGVKVGGTESTIQTDLPSEDPLRRRGISWTAFAEWNAPGALSLVTEAGVLERGYSRMSGATPDLGSGAGYTYRQDRRMQYVSVAALAKLPVLRMGPASAYALAGPRMNALVGRRGEDAGGGMPDYAYNDVVWDVTAGVGVEGLRVLPLVVEARYNAGLNDALRGEGWRGEAYHRAVDVMVGIRF